MDRAENTLAKEHLLIMCNVLFCHNVFKSCLLQWRQKTSVSGKGLQMLSLLFCYFYRTSNVEIGLTFSVQHQLSPLPV